MSQAFDVYNIFNNYQLEAIKDNTYNFLILKLLTFINTQKKKFRNKFTFFGDENFTPTLQKQLLSSCWDLGCAGITRLGGKNGILVVYACIPTKINNQGEVEEALGILSSSLNHFENRKRFQKDSFNMKLTNKDTVFLVYNSEFISGLAEAMPSAVNYAECWTAHKNVVMLTPARLSSNRNNSDNVNDGLEESIKNFDLILRTKSSKDSQPYVLQNFGISKNPMEEILPLNLSVIEMVKNNNLSELSSAINDVKSDYDEMIGNRTNINFKAERNITSEFSFSNIHFALLENDFNASIISFIINYKNVFNIDIDAVDEIQEMIQQDANLNTTGDDNTSDIINAEQNNNNDNDEGGDNNG